MTHPTTNDPAQSRNQLWKTIASITEPNVQITLDMARFPSAEAEHLQSVAQIHFAENGVFILGFAQLNTRVTQRNEIEKGLSVATGGVIMGAIHEGQKQKEANNAIAHALKTYAACAEGFAPKGLRERFVSAIGEVYFLGRHELKNLNLPKAAGEPSIVETVYGNIELPQEMPAAVNDALSTWWNAPSANVEGKTIWTQAKAILFCRHHNSDQKAKYLASPEATDLGVFFSRQADDSTELSHTSRLLVSSLENHNLWAVCRVVTAVATPASAVFADHVASTKRQRAIRALLVWIGVITISLLLVVGIPTLLVSIGQQRRAAEMQGPFGLIVVVVWFSSVIALLCSPFAIRKLVRAISQSKEFRTPSAAT